MATAGQDTHQTRPMRADARRNYERLIAAAREAFTEHGAEAPLDDIARRAGVGPGTLYRHFPTRLTLLEAVYREDIDRLSKRAGRLAKERPPEEALRAWMWEQVDYVLQRRALAITLKTALDRDSETLVHCKTAMRGAAEAVLVPAKEAGVVRSEVSASDLLRLGHGVAYASENAPEDAGRLLSYLLDGLRPQP
jgi:AcrR family transcriptional regulator